MIQLRKYQTKTIQKVEQAWAQGATSTLVVAPPGAGKTEMGAQLAKGRRTLWVAPTRELVLQAEDRLREIVGRENVGVIMPGIYPRPRAGIQVATIESALSRIEGWKWDLTVLDEAQHFMADHYREVTRLNRKGITAGLTATPERRDGRALGDIFDVMVVAASYSELIRAGILVPAKVLRPDRYLASDLARDPVEAMLEFAPSLSMLLFLANVRGDLGAYKIAGRLRHAHIRTETIEGAMLTGHRDEIIARFRIGLLQALTSVFTLTEGLNVPSVGGALLGRAFGFDSGMLQATGRALRASPGKTHGLIIDLTGCTHRNGLPDEDRTYSLTGRAISGSPREAPPEPPDRKQEILGLDLAFADGSPVNNHPIVPETKEQRKAAAAAEAFEVRLRTSKGMRSQSVKMAVRARHDKFLRGSMSPDGAPK